MLLVGRYEADRALVRQIIRSLGWKLREARDRRQAVRRLRDENVAIVLAETAAPNRSWKRLASDLCRLCRPPHLIVTSRTADDWLWAEALNFGAFDVLAQPFVADELERSVASAFRNWAFRPERAPSARAATAAYQTA